MNYNVLLNQLRDPIRLGYCSQGDRVLIEEAADAIEELQKPKWIPVSERLPDFEGAVLCMRKSHIHKDLRHQEVLYFDYDVQWFQEMWSDVFVEDGCVTHWMPLPKPPKGGEY